MMFYKGICHKHSLGSSASYSKMVVYDHPFFTKSPQT